ncbi:MAG: 23S rRNA (guanosine(2251)-2'-O)-methyltransferase RlmB [Rickettsiales bacterium]|nr:23S rRNA (guanosine(2251)-2'-O)-methyltransferase RlmB [Rickettsiales bacterium]
MQHRKTDNSNTIWLYGKHSSFSAIANNRRKIFKILVTKNTQSELDNFLSKNKFSTAKNLVRLVEASQIESIVGNAQPHQGIAVECSKIPTKNQIDLLEELYKLEKDQLPNLLLLDQLSDPQNIGAIIRSAVSFGVKKIIFCEHNAPKENAAMAKSSAGTIEIADLIVVTNFNNLIEKLKKIGYWCIGLEGKSNHFINEIKDYKPIALVIGSEGNGIRDLVKKNCDILAKIPIDEKVESLNASVAASIALYELSRGNK